MMAAQKTEQSPKKNQGGFTLIEVLIAIVILSVGLLGMASLNVGIIKGNKLSGDLTTATTLAQDKMEDIRRQGYAGVTPEDRAPCTTPYSKYEREVSVSVDDPAPRMKTITVTAYWRNSIGNPSVELKTILAQ
ncbi:MAG: prepilin-type N-terminal cleavage/methylation domain-containing protein [Deltaproteobacteria bacterium]|nr:prepilin-type N-terminal cleavage/methylation domain-containing protein [Deltaproteobacteria bacterium]